MDKARQRNTASSQEAWLRRGFRQNMATAELAIDPALIARSPMRFCFWPSLLSAAGQISAGESAKDDPFIKFLIVSFEYFIQLPPRSLQNGNIPLQNVPRACLHRICMGCVASGSLNTSACCERRNSYISRCDWRQCHAESFCTSPCKGPTLEWLNTLHTQTCYQGEKFILKLSAKDFQGF